MLFNSLQFLVFFVIVTLLYFSLPKRFTVSLLLFASIYFYMVFKPEYILILFFTIIIDYIAGILLEDAVGHKRKVYLIMSLVANIGVLAFFKYFNFFNHNLDDLLSNFHSQTPFPFLKILLPIGLSFHTFQAMSYTIEVYRGNHKAERNFMVYSLYVMFYPQLVAGPIERPQNILYQLHAKHKFDYEKFRVGLMMMAVGFFKKVVIADRLSIAVDYTYAHPATQSSFTYLVTAVFYSFQIYCDFSGYTDIAIGSALVMGIDLMQNFRSPYFSKTMPEFWSRWHISLSTWFRDYVYISLGGNRVTKLRLCFNIFVVFLLSGLWHGANWTFIVWGCIHAFYMIMTNVFNWVFKKDQVKNKPNATVQLLQMVFTFFLVTMAWIFFRASSIKQAVAVIKTIFSFKTTPHTVFGLNNTEMLFSAGLIILLVLKDRFYPKIEIKQNVWYYAVLISIALFCYLFGVFNVAQFIYFQF